MKFHPSLSSFNVVIIIIYDAPSRKSPGAYEDIRTPTPTPYTHTHTQIHAYMRYFTLLFIISDATNLFYFSTPVEELANLGILLVYKIANHKKLQYSEIYLN